jgi:hypothetical protein
MIEIIVVLHEVLELSDNDVLHGACSWASRTGENLPVYCELDDHSGEIYRMQLCLH